MLGVLQMQVPYSPTYYKTREGAFDLASLGLGSLF